MDRNSTPDNIALAIQQFSEQAKRLGVTWDLFQGTTQGDINERHSAFAARVTLDGDNTPISANSLIGILPGNLRVFVLFVPPSGAYIIGRTDASNSESPYIINNLIINNMLTIDGLVHATNPIMRRVSNEQGGNITAYTDTTFALGATPCGGTFTAPPSGNGILYWHAAHRVNTSNSAYVSAELRTGTTIGAGTVIFGATTDIAVTVGDVLGTEIGAGVYKRITGLTPDFEYNFATRHRVSGGNGTIFYRSIMWEPEW
jgi:hypothetical protein